MRMMRIRWLRLVVLLLVMTVAAQEEEAAVAAQEEGEEDGGDRFHPDKGVNDVKDETVVPGAASVSFSFTTGGTSVPSPEVGNHTNELNTTTDPYSYDENNTVEVSVSLALPTAWNLTSQQDEEAVDALVEDVSTAATQLFHTTLDHAITMLEGSPQTLLQDVAKTADDNPTKVPSNDSDTAPLPSNPTTDDHTAVNDTHVLSAVDGNQTYVNSTDSNVTGQAREVEKPSAAPQTQTSATLLWDWLGMVPLSKEDLYKMVLEYLEIEDEEDWQNATETSPLLKSLKAEIRQAIHDFFFQGQNATNTDNNSTSSNEPNTPYNNNTDWIPNDPNAPTESPENSFTASGLWEMFLADTRVELVQVSPEDTYAWWQLTMIYPVYVHYQASYDPDAVQTSQLDETTNWKNGTAEEATPYWVPVTDQGTLDFISRLLQRVLEAAVHSGAFLSSLNSLQETEEDLIGEILALTIPGMEYALDELIDPFAEAPEEADMGDSSREQPVDDEPMEPPWALGTYTESILDDDDGPRGRECMGVALLLVTLLGVSGMVGMAIWRNVVAQRAMEKAWLLGTDQDVAELLQVGWRQYEAPPPQQQRPPTEDPDEQHDEVFEVFDKSREGYYDNDSMLHGSAMQQSYLGYDSASEVPSANMEYERHLERHKGREEHNTFKAILDDTT